MHFFGTEAKYARISRSEDVKPMLPFEDDESSTTKVEYNRDALQDTRESLGRQRASRLKWTGLAFHICSGLTFLLGLAMLVVSMSKECSDSQCIKRLTIWSPLVDIAEMEEITFQNEFMHQTEFRGPPTPEKELAWKSITHFAGVNIPMEKLPLYKKPADMEWFHTLPEQGGGLFAGLEAFHQLHCLNIIRKYTWLDHYEGVPIGFNNDTRVVRAHVDHCLETLRLTLMCNADLTPYFMQEDASIPVLGGQNDFNVHHKCKKWDVLTEWMHRNAVNGPLVHTGNTPPTYSIKSDEQGRVLHGG